MLLSEGIETYLTSMAGIMAHGSIVFYQRRLPSLLSHLGDQPIDAITLADLRGWRGALAARTTRWGGGSSHPQITGGPSPHYVHQFVRSARRMFKWFEEEGLIRISPARRLELPPLPRQYRRGITTVDRDRMLALARTNPRDSAILLLAADTACRRGGLAALCLADLDLEHCTAILTEKGRGGMGKQRVVFYLQKTRDALRSYLELRPPVAHDHVFCGSRGGKLSESAIYEIFRRLARALGIERGWNPHNWRHAAIRAMLANGMSLPAVSQIAGHSSVQTTGDMYGVFSEAELAAMHRACSWMSVQPGTNPPGK